MHDGAGVRPLSVETKIKKNYSLLSAHCHCSVLLQLTPRPLPPVSPSFSLYLPLTLSLPLPLSLPLSIILSLSLSLYPPPYKEFLFLKMLLQNREGGRCSSPAEMRTPCPHRGDYRADRWLVLCLNPALC